MSFKFPFFSICIFVSCFIFLLWKWVTAVQIASGLAVSTIAGFALWWTALPSKDRTLDTRKFYALQFALHFSNLVNRNYL